jgi:hypothetical protein
LPQINIEFLNNVPEEFKEKYFSKPRNYNPLQVGNVWQYYDAEYNVYNTTRVAQDSIINGIQYFKKVHFDREHFISWERNCTTSGASFMLDFEDVNNNGDFLEELPLDSLENPWWSRYRTYKYSFDHEFFWSGEKSVLVKDTNWVIIDGDTIISRNVEILELFWWEMIIEGFGMYAHSVESPVIFCTGAIVNGKQYGTIVSVDERMDRNPADFSLGNNYPNPFNSSTIITYSVPKLSNQSDVRVRLLVCDMLGREVATLVDEYKTAGIYEVEFNAEKLSTGIYFYQFKAGEYTSVKKMILLK